MDAKSRPWDLIEEENSLQMIFENFVKRIEFVIFLTIPRSPQQNGITKIKNRAILDMAWNMLMNKKLPKEF